eukprot:gene15214-45028_t
MTLAAVAPVGPAGAVGAERAVATLPQAKGGGISE